MHFRPNIKTRARGAHPPTTLLSVTPQDPWYKNAALRRLMLPIVVLYAVNLSTGFDATLTANLQSFRQWREDMGTPTPSQLGMITAIYFIGAFSGSIPASHVTDIFGRKWGVIIGQILTTIGAAFQAGSQGRGQYMGARFILGFGIAFNMCAAATLLSELAHPQFRGILVSLFNPFWYVGSITAAWTCFGTSHMPVTDDWAWRIPSLLQAMCPCFVLSLIYWVPESPRWLVAKGRKDEAEAIIAKYHCNGDQNDVFARTQIAEIEMALEQAREGIKWSALVTNKPNRSRLSIVIVMVLMCLWCGQNVITYYFSAILNSIGITGTTQQTGINGGINIVCLISAVTGAFLVDKVGRRKLWMSSFAGMIVIGVPFTVLSAVYAQTRRSSAGYGVVVCLFFYDIAYNIACNPLLYSYPTEIMPFFMRARGLAVKTLVGQVALIINMYVNPIALAAIGYHYYIFFIGLNCFWLTLIFFFFPETKGYSLEELAVLFDEDAVTSRGVLDGEKLNGTCPSTTVGDSKAYNTVEVQSMSTTTEPKKT